MRVKLLEATAAKIDGGRDTFLDLLAIAASDDDDAAREFLEVYHQLSTRERLFISLDHVALAAKASTVDLLKALVGAAVATHLEIGNLMAAVAQPAIVEATIRNAKRNRGQSPRDRDVLHKHSTFTPVPRGSTINVTATAGAQAEAGAAAQSNGEPAAPSFLTDATVADTARAQLQHRLRELPEAVIADDVLGSRASAPVEAAR